MFANLKVNKVSLITNENYTEPHTSLLNCVTIAIAGLGGFLFGYANNSISGSLAQTSFQKYFFTDPSKVDSIIGGILGGFFSGGLIGAIIQAPISQKWGRRIATGTAALLLVISGGIQTGSINIGMFLAGRVLCGIGAGMVVTNKKSPRWLVEQEKYDEAWKVLERLHRNKNDPDANLVKAEMIQIRAQVDAERILPSGYIYIFKTPALRKRAFCSILVWIMGQSTGVLVIANLTPTLFGGLGYSIPLQLGLSVAWTACALLATFVNAAIMDRYGRVRLLVIGGYFCSASLICEAVLQEYYLGTNNESCLKGAVAMFFIFVLFYCAFIDCAAYVYIAEIWPTHLRSQGSTIGLVSFFVTSIAYNSSSSLVFSTIGWRFYLVMVAVCILSSTIILFYLPETASLTLEEIGSKFGDHVEVDIRNINLKTSSIVDERPFESVQHDITAEGKSE